MRQIFKMAAIPVRGTGLDHQHSCFGGSKMLAKFGNDALCSFFVFFFQLLQFKYFDDLAEKSLSRPIFGKDAFLPDCCHSSMNRIMTNFEKTFAIRQSSTINKVVLDFSLFRIESDVGRETRPNFGLINATKFRKGLFKYMSEFLKFTL